jgi:hypothetical protein
VTDTTVVLDRPVDEAVSDRREVDRWVVGAAVSSLIGLGFCVWATRLLTVTDIGDTGLGTVLGWRYWVGFALLQAGFGVAVCRRRLPRWLLTVQIAMLVMAVFGAASLVSDIPRGEAAWRHLGVIDNLIRNGHPDPAIDAYFNWPGFFALFAALAKAAGLPMLEVVRWAPVWNNALWLAVVGVTLRQITPDVRQVWLAVWLFASVNWIDQDYFSPQAFAFLLYLMIIAVVLRWLRSEPLLPLRALLRDARGDSLVAGIRDRTHAVRHWWASRTPAPARITPAQRTAALVIVMVLAAAMVASHQLTPFAVIAAVAALVVTGRSVAARLPLALCVLVVCWLAYLASSYLAGHPVAPSGDLSSTAAANVVSRLDGSAGHLAVLRLRMLLTGALWLVAGIGAVRRLHAGHHDVIGPALALACAPFLLIPVQSYGGEMLLRVTLFSLPFFALLAAGALLPEGNPRLGVRLPVQLLVIVVCTALGVASVIGRYGNAGFDMSTRGEVAAVATVYKTAHKGDVLIAAAHPTPWRYRDYDTYRHITLQELCPRGVDADGCYHIILGAASHAPSHGGLVLITSANRDSLRVQGLMSEADLAEFERLLTRTPGVRIRLDNKDARLYELRPASDRSSP